MSMKMQAIIAVILTVIVVQCKAECAEDWSERNDTCYKMSNDTQSWENAKEKCENLTAHLVKIESEGQNDFLLNSFLQLTDNETSIEAWIGLNDKVSEGTFLWTDGTSPTYTNWADHQPNDENSQDCAEIANGVFWPGGTPQVGVWNDYHCERKINYICEKEAS